MGRSRSFLLLCPFIRKYLADMSLVAVRESVSDNYLYETLGLNNIILMADPAFNLIPESRFTSVLAC